MRGCPSWRLRERGPAPLVHAALPRVGGAQREQAGERVQVGRVRVRRGSWGHLTGYRRLGAAGVFEPLRPAAPGRG